VFGRSSSGSYNDLDLAPLPADGEYTIVVDPQYNGSVTLTLSTPQESTIAVDGLSVPLYFPRPGQDARLHFTGQAGLQLRLRISESTIQYSQIRVFNPSGAQIASSVFGRTSIGEYSDLDLAPLPADGEYTIVVDPQYNGSVFVRLMTRL
jgi:hypothetical protein